MMGRPKLCRTCACPELGADGVPFCPVLRKSVKLEAKAACGGVHHVKGQNQIMAKPKCTPEQLSAKRSAAARQVRHHGGGRPKGPSGRPKVVSTSTRILTDDLRVFREVAFERRMAITTLLHECAAQMKQRYPHLDYDRD